ncbi:hypothetical protein ASL10_00630 [Frigoribacterium sp. Leaf8]|nr:hypothetical protein ASL10_00630 [Frigoribacterium sp. Leaf8]
MARRQPRLSAGASAARAGLRRAEEGGTAERRPPTGDRPPLDTRGPASRSHDANSADRSARGG